VESSGGSGRIRARLWRQHLISAAVVCSTLCPQVYDEATEVIDLRVFSSVKSSEDYTNRTHSFDVYSAEMVFSMVASSESEKEDWIRAIGRAIVISRTKSWQDESNPEDQ